MAAPATSWSTVSMEKKIFLAEIHPFFEDTKLTISILRKLLDYSYVLPQMLGPTSALDPSLHYVNMANQLQSLQLGNPGVGSYLSPQQWPVWPGGVSSKQSGATPATDHGGYNNVD